MVAVFLMRFETVNGGAGSGPRASQSVTVVVPPSQYSGLGFGADIVPTKSLTLWKGTDITLTTGNTNIIFGSSSNVLTRVFIDGEPQETEQLALKKGLEGLFSEYFGANHAAFAGNTQVSFRRERVFQTRGQFDGAGELHTQMSKLKVTWTPLVRFRKYSKAKTDAASPLDLSWTVKLALGLKVALLATLVGQGALTSAMALVSAHVLSRLAPLFLIRWLPYVGDENAASKSKPLADAIGNGALMVGIAWSIPAAALLVWSHGALHGLAALLLCALAATCVARLLVRRLQGFTGDGLGATQQVCELAIYLALAWQA